VNGKRAIDYFQHVQREECILPFVVTQSSGLFDVWCTVKGGGISGNTFFLLLIFFFYYYLFVLLAYWIIFLSALLNFNYFGSVLLNKKETFELK
jgi:hypothetical protein